MRVTSAACLAAICSASLIVTTRGAPARALAAAATSARYHCPMHPSIAQDHQGDCPICGMKLVPVEKAPVPATGPAPTPGTMAIGGRIQNVLGIAVSPVQRSAGARKLRLLGRVVPDETRLYRLNAGVSGSIRDLSTVTTGSRVRKDQVLGSFYAPETLSALQIYVLNLGANDRVKKARAQGSVEGEGERLGQVNLQQRTLQLENYGVSSLQREVIARTREVPDTIQIVAPADGFVLARSVSPGLKFDRGFEFYRIADLRQVWVLADVFPQDARHVRAGLRAQVSVPDQPATLPATVAEILPQFDAVSRTLKVKLVLDNPGYVLRPDMFVDVSLPVELPSALVVPADAIVDSGLARTVFVQSGEGVFQPRRIETGWRSGDQVEVVRGLAAGEQVVTSGTFFLDSETRLRSPAPPPQAGTSR